MADAVEVRESPGKGLGVFAKRDIVKGTRIVSERPLLTRKDLQSQINALSPNIKNSFYTLRYVAIEGKSIELSIFDNNSWPCPDLGCDALFPCTARINHSCTPNAIQRYNSVLKKNTVQLLWAVEKDAEIKICYIEPSMAYNARQDSLKRRWGFSCTCVICKAPCFHDEERERIGVLRRCLLLRRSPEGEGHLDPMAMAMELMDLLNREGLMDYWPLAYRIVKQHWGTEGNAEKYREWEAMEQGVEEIMRGRDDDIAHSAGGHSKA